MQACAAELARGPSDEGINCARRDSWVLPRNTANAFSVSLWRSHLCKVSLLKNHSFKKNPTLLNYGLEKLVSDLGRSQYYLGLGNSRNSDTG